MYQNVTSQISQTSGKYFLGGKEGSIFKLFKKYSPAKLKIPSLELRIILKVPFLIVTQTAQAFVFWACKQQISSGLILSLASNSLELPLKHLSQAWAKSAPQVKKIHFSKVINELLQSFFLKYANKTTLVQYNFIHDIASQRAYWTLDVLLFEARQDVWAGMSHLFENNGTAFRFLQETD